MSTITVRDGTTVYYKDWGDGPVITFSHGWPLNSDAWGNQLLSPQQQYPILSSIMTGAQDTCDESPIDDVEFGLDCILDGIGRLVAGRTP